MSIPPQAVPGASGGAIAAETGGASGEAVGRNDRNGGRGSGEDESRALPERGTAFLSWRLHLIAFLAICAAELIHTQEIEVGRAVILILPMTIAFAFTVLLNQNVTPVLRGRLTAADNGVAADAVMITLLPLVTLFALAVGSQIREISAAGPALLLQELGNLGTLLLSIPVGVLLLGMGRELIGAGHSVAREPNVAVVANRYGIASAEGTGVLAVFMVGTLLGTLVFSIMASTLASTTDLRVEALAMSCGVGSSSMMTACVASLAHIHPEARDLIVGLATASDVLTGTFSVYVAIFVTLPVAERLYALCRRFRRERADAAPAGAAASLQATGEGEHEVGWTRMAGLLLISLAASFVAHLAGPGILPSSIWLGMLCLYALVVLGIVVGRMMPFRAPAILYVTTIAVILSIPAMPTAPFLAAATAQLDFVALSTPILAYAGLSLSRAVVEVLRKVGLKLALIAILVFVGTFLGSVTVAELVLGFIDPA